MGRVGPVRHPHQMRELVGYLPTKSRLGLFCPRQMHDSQHRPSGNEAQLYGAYRPDLLARSLHDVTMTPVGVAGGGRRRSNGWIGPGNGR